MKRIILLALLAAALPLEAQTARDSSHVRAQKARLDSVLIPMNALRRWCAVASYKTPNYLRTTCAIANRKPDSSARRFEDSLLVPPASPVNQKPFASYSVTCDAASDVCRFDAATSTDDKGIASYTWRSVDSLVTDRPPMFTPTITRRWLSGCWTEWLTVTDSAGLKDSTSRKVPCKTTAPPPPIDTTTPPSTGTVAVPALPRSVPVVPLGLGSLCTTNVAPGGLQAALNTMQGGWVLCLTGTHVGSFTVSTCSSSWATIRSAGTIPTGRMRPSFAGPLAKIVANGTGAMSALRFLPRACKVLVLGIEITTVSTSTDGPTALVEVGTGAETTVGDLPTDIAFDRVYIHGWPTQKVRRAFALNGGAQTVTNSWCAEVHDNADSQCVISWNGSGPLLIFENTLEAASENIMLGGADSRIPGVVVSDVTIRRNHIAKPLSWKGAGWNVKNLIESKVGARVLIEDNVLDGSWLDGQTGYAFVIKSTNQQGTCRWCSSSDWTVRRNLVRNVGAAITVSGRGDNTATDSSNRRMAFEENWFEGVNVAPYNGDGRLLLLGPDNRDIIVRRNVFEGGAVREAVLFADTTTRNIDLTGNVFPVGAYGLFTGGSSPGLASWNAGPRPSKTWANAMIGSSGGATYPAGTTWHSSLSAALTGTGLSRSLIDAATQGVVVPPEP